MEKSLKVKLAKIKNGTYTPQDFIIADAKDGDMGGGIFVVGESRQQPGKPRPFTDYIEEMRQVTQSGFVDIMLMSASSAEQLVHEKIFDNSPVTPAVRFNDATDIWSQRHSKYGDHKPKNFRTVNLNSVKDFIDLGLFSITYTNDLENDLAFMAAFNQFVYEISQTDMNYFLEVFNPKVDIGISNSDIPAFVNDSIVKTLAGLTTVERPLFLKMPFNGPAAMEELCNYNPGKLIVGILGGAKGTMRDTFELIFQGEKYGARVALFGRKIQFSESPLKTVELMRAVVSHEISPSDAVKIYHAHLKEMKITPKLSLDDDLKITEGPLIH
jgi:hypothetical protein